MFRGLFRGTIGERAQHAQFWSLPVNVLILVIGIATLWVILHPPAPGHAPIPPTSSVAAGPPHNLARDILPWIFVAGILGAAALQAWGYRAMLQATRLRQHPVPQAPAAAPVIAPATLPAPAPGYEFWPRRVTGPSLEILFSEAQDIWAAWVNGRAVRSQAGLRNSHITRLILVDPESEYVDVVARSEGDRPREELEAEIRHITNEAYRLGILVKWFRGPITSFMLGNPTGGSSWVKADLAALYIVPDDRPTCRIRDPQTVQTYRGMYERMWEAAEEAPHTVFNAAPAAVALTLADRVHFQPHMARTVPHLVDLSPYVDLYFGFVNAAGYDLTFRGVDGLVSYPPGNPLPNPLVSIGSVVSASAYQLLVIRNGEQNGFTLRQWVSRNIADQILTEMVNTRAAVVLDTHAIAIRFSYRDKSGKQQELPVGIPGAPFSISPGSAGS